MSQKLQEIVQEWDEGVENGFIDEGDLFGRLVEHCEELEGKMAFALEQAKGIEKYNFNSIKRTIISILNL
ncbi:protein of unknown function [Tenacibaculum sp. 190524A02b]|uniref:Uncharacterized protein n=1 Tax=Tenacibaculum vairaonense TaxID=3137860 RepID=A0ABP1F8I2_9FLAO